MSIEPLLFTGTTTDPALPAAPFERVSYSFGQLLGADEFQTDQRYHHVRHRLHQLALHGYGVVCGMGISYAEDELVVAQGLAVDSLGRDLFIDAVQCLPVPNLHVTDLWADLPSTDDEPPTGVTSLRLAWVVLRYRHCMSDPVAAYGLGCGSTGRQERPSRVRDSFSITLESAAPAAPEPWVGTWTGTPIDGQKLPDSWRDDWLAHSRALPGSLQHIWDGTHTDTGVALARVVLGVTDDGSGGEKTTVVGIDERVRPLLPRVQTAIAALSGANLDGPSQRQTLRLQQVEVVTAFKDEPIELLLHFTEPVVHGTAEAANAMVAHTLDAAWTPVVVTVHPPEPDLRTVRISLAAVVAGQPIRLTLDGAGATPISDPAGRPLSGWSTDPIELPSSRGRTVAHHIQAPAEARP